MGHILMTLARGVGLRPVPNSGWLLRMVDAGLLGKKTGRGFYDYTH